MPSLTVFTSDKAPLGKRFWLADGAICKESFATFYAGTAEIRPTATATDLATILDGLGPRQALASGVLIDGTKARIGTRAKAGHGERVRSLADFAFPRAPGWLLWDFDARTMPPDVAGRVEALGGPVRAFFHLWPEAEAGPYVIRPSSSDGVTAPGCDAIRSAGLHGFFLIEDVSQSKAVLETLQERAWAEGLAWCALSKSGAVLIRSIVDVAVGSPERLIFEAPPILEAPVTRLPRPTLIHDAATPLAAPETPLEVAARAASQETAARSAIKPEARRVEEAFVEERARAEVQRTGKPLSEARASIRQMMRGAVLEDGHLLQLGDGNWVRVGEILDAPARWDRRSIPDPIEGLAYGRDKATLLLRPRPGHPDEKPALVSHAHGQRTVYRFARYQGDPPPQPFHPAPEGDRLTARAKHPAAIQRFFRAALPRIQGAQDVKRDEAALPEGMNPRERKTAQHAIRRGAQARHGLDYLPTAELRADQAPPRMMLGGAQGVGKTMATEECLATAGGVVSLVLAPDHAKVAEIAASLRKRTDERSPIIVAVKGRDAQDETEGQTMCRIPAAAKMLAQRGVSVPATLCTRCPFKDACGYRRQEARLERLAQDPAGLVMIAPRAYWKLPLPGRVTPDLVVLDEAPPQLGHRAEPLTFDTLAEPLTYEGPKRRKGKIGETAEEADARAVLLADVRPVLVAVRDAFQEEPETAMRLLRARGVDAARLERVLASLSLYEDQRIDAKLGAQFTAFTFALQDGHPFDLDKRLVTTIEAHEGKQLRAICHLLEALRIEVAHGRDEPVAVRRAEDLGEGRKGVVAHLLDSPHFGPEVPFLHLDGTGDHKIAEALFGPLALEWHPVERHAIVTQITGKSFSRQSILGTNARGEPVWPKEAERLRAELVALCHEQPGALVVANKAVVAALKADGLQNATAHFGALRGLNHWEQFSAIIVIGREQTSPAALEGPGRALAARAGDVFHPMALGERLPVERRGLRLRKGGAVAVDVERHPDPWADCVLRQIREAEVLQALDRVRPHYKPDPVRVTLLCPLALDVTVDEVKPWAEVRRGGSKVARAVASGVLPLSATEAATAFPHLWAYPKAALRDSEFTALRYEIEGGVWLGHSPKENLYLEFVPSKAPAVLVTYRRPSEGGRGGSRTVFRALVLASAGNALAVLVEVMGPVEGFQIEAMNQAAAAPPPAVQLAAPVVSHGAVNITLPQPSPVPVPAPVVALRPAVGRSPP